jgi:hypothetical protein
VRWHGYNGVSSEDHLPGSDLGLAPWRDMTRPTLDEMYYDPMKARPTRNPPSARRMLTKHHERKMPKNLGHIESLARSYTDTAIKTLAGIMMEQTSPPMARIVAAKVLLDRGWGDQPPLSGPGGMLV